MSFLNRFLRITLLLSLCLSSIPRAQPFPAISGTASMPNKYKALKVGDTLPEVLLKHLINYPSKTASLSAFHGKFLLLDLWSIYCASCIEGFPKMEALQKHFGDSLQIMLVNPWQPEKIVRDLFTRRALLTKNQIDLPADCGDTFLLQLFPEEGVPHLVWIDQQAVVRSITFETQVTEKNLSRMIRGERVQLHQKTEFHLNADFGKPLFVAGNAGKGDGILWTSTLSEYVDGMESIEYMAPDSQHRASMAVSVAPIEGLYACAYSNREDFYGHFTSLRLSHVIREMKDTGLFMAIENGEDIWDNMYTYQVTAPHATKSELQSWMQADLRRYFGYQANWEKRNMPCLILTIDDTTLVKPTGDSVNSLISDREVNINNVSMPYLVNYLEAVTNYFYSSYPILYESAFAGLVGGIRFTTDVNDYKSFGKALEAYHIHLRLENRLVNVLVIRDPPATSPLADN